MKQNLSQEWLKSAYSDLVVIDSIVDNDIVTHMTAFHAQQAVEKSLKAILESKKITVPKKHDIRMLKKLVSEYIIIDDDYILDALNTLYLDSRYPSSFGLLPEGKPTLDEAKEFYNFAQNVFNEVCSILNIDQKEIKK